MFGWTETFYFTNKQDSLNDNAEFNCVRCTNVFFVDVVVVYTEFFFILFYWKGGVRESAVAP